MSGQDLKAYVAAWIQAMNKGKNALMPVVDGTCDTNLVFHSAYGKDVHGPREFKQFIDEYYDAFPDSHYAIEDIFAEGDKVAVRLTFTGTHEGAFMGIQPTNKKVTISIIHIVRIVGRKFVEGWERYDTLGLMQQLGVTPTSGKRR